MRRSTVTLLATALLVLLSSVGAVAQTAAEKCLAMRLSVLGASVSNSLACNAWSVATRTAPNEPCLAYGEQQLAQRLRAAGCATEPEIADLLDRARDATAILVDSQIAASRVAEFESTRWRTEVILDQVRVYTPGLPWPDQSCRSQGFCADLMILDCQTTQSADGSLDTSCDSVPESSTEVHAAPVLTTENIALPTGEILSRGSAGASYEVVIRMDAAGETYTGEGAIGVSPLFITGRRVE